MDGEIASVNFEEGQEVKGRRPVHLDDRAVRLAPTERGQSSA
jgi:hypothetical protein